MFSPCYSGGQEGREVQTPKECHLNGNLPQKPTAAQGWIQPVSTMHIVLGKREPHPDCQGIPLPRERRVALVFILHWFSKLKMLGTKLQALGDVAHPRHLQCPE